MDYISKKVKSVVLMTNPLKDKDYAEFFKVLGLLESQDADIRLLDSYRDIVGVRPGVTYYKEEQLYCSADAAIVLGGDGTILRSAQYAIREQCPILGVNLGRVGYMAEIGKDEVALITRLFEGRYKISERMTLNVRVIDGDRSYTVCEYALNDAVFHSASIGRVLGFTVYCDGARVAEHRGDGVIVSTPTGSTAYSMSAGGPVLDPVLECICVTPVCSVSPAARSMIFSADGEFHITACSDNRGEVFLSCDGSDGITISKNAKVIISRADKKAKLIAVGKKEFFNVLSKKITSAM